MTTPDLDVRSEIRQILGEEDWKYTEKPAKLEALLDRVRISEIEGLFPELEQADTFTYYQVDADAIKDRIAKLKASKEERNK